MDKKKPESIFYVNILCYILFLLFVCISSFSYSSQQSIKGHSSIVIKGDHDEVYLNSVEGKTEVVPDFQPARCELRIPSKSVLLERKNLIDLLKQRTNIQEKNKKVIQISIIGIGGVGKTTLARMWAKSWAKQHPKASIWEINADNFDKLSNSFKELSVVLAQNTHQKEELRLIDQIPNPEDTLRRRIVFIKNILRQHPGWLLIYDNIESWSSIVKYMPQDDKSWGAGVVILTTRNHHIKNASTLTTNNIIEVGELREDESITLFSRLCFKKEPLALPTTEIKKIEILLNHVPPFPLDISMAAKYIAIYHSSYGDYIFHLQKQKKEFYENQQSLLNETSNYAQTRYGIITLSIKKLLEINKNFSELLFFISLIDSKEIPRELLDHFSSKTVVDQFLYEMQKHSLFTSESLRQGFYVFSVHRSTQDICKLFFQNLQINRFHPLFKRITDSLELYVSTLIEDENLYKLRNLYIHCKKLFLHEEMIEDIKGSGEMVLGLISFYLADDNLNTKKLLENSLIGLKKNEPQHALRIAKALAHLGATFWRLEDSNLGLLCLQESLKIYKTTNDTVGFSQALNFLGLIYLDLGFYEEGKNLLEKHLETYEKVPNFRKSISKTHFYLGMIYRELGDYSKAQESMKKGFRMACETKCDEIRRAWLTSFLGNVYKEMGEYSRAKEILEESFQVFKKEGIKNFYFQWVCVYIANIYRILGYYKKSMEIFKKSFDSNLDNSFSALHPYLGKIYYKVGFYEQSKYHLEKAKKLYVRLYGEYNVKTLWIDISLAQLYMAQENYLEASLLLEKCLEYHRKYLSPSHPRIAKILIKLSEAYLCLGKIPKEKISSLLEEGGKVYENIYGKEHLKLAEVYLLRGKLYMKKNELEKAEKEIIQAIRITERYKHPDKHFCFETLAELYSQKASQLKGQDLAAARFYKKKSVENLSLAWKISKEIYPSSSVHIKRIKNLLDKQRKVAN